MNKTSSPFLKSVPLAVVRHRVISLDHIKGSVPIPLSRQLEEFSYGTANMVKWRLEITLKTILATTLMCLCMVVGRRLTNKQKRVNSSQEEQILSNRVQEIQIQRETNKNALYKITVYCVFSFLHLARASIKNW